MEQAVRQYEGTLLRAPGEVPEIHPGDTVRVHINFYAGAGEGVPVKKIHRIAAKGKLARGEVKVERVQIFEGTVLSLKGSGTRRKLTVRKTSGGVGVEKTWFIHSRKINRIEVLRRARVRRAKLYYLRQRVGKGTRLQEKRSPYTADNGA